MQDNSAINKARALYYNLFENFFVQTTKTENYFELLRLINILKENPLDPNSGRALESISNKLDKTSNVDLIQEYDDIFHNPLTKKVRTTASFYDEGVESGKKRVEMIQFVAKTEIRRDENSYFEYEDSIGFIFAILASLSDKVANGETKYENTVHCIFAQILNEFIDEFAKDVYEHEKAEIFRELMVVLHSFIEFERLYLEVTKPAPKEKIQKEACETISEEEMERRARNKAMKALGPKNAQDESCPVDIAYDVETEV